MQKALDFGASAGPAPRPPRALHAAAHLGATSPGQASKSFDSEDIESKKICRKGI